MVGLCKASCGHFSAISYEMCIILSAKGILGNQIKIGTMYGFGFSIFSVTYPYSLKI